MRPLKFHHNQRWIFNTDGREEKHNIIYLIFKRTAK